MKISTDGNCQLCEAAAGNVDLNRRNVARLTHSQCVTAGVSQRCVFLFFPSLSAWTQALSLSVCVIDWPTKSAITRTPDHRSMGLPKHQIRAWEMAAQHANTHTHTQKNRDTGRHTNTPVRCKHSDADKQKPTDPTHTHTHTSLPSSSELSVAAEER